MTTTILDIGPCSIAYKGAIIGMTLDSPLLNIEPELYESESTQSGGMNIRKIIANTTITISVKVKEIDDDFANFLDADGRISKVIFGEEVLVTGGELGLAPLGGGGNICYCFSKAVLKPETVCAYKNTEDHYLKLEFAVYEDLEGVLLQKNINELKN